MEFTIQSRNEAYKNSAKNHPKNSWSYQRVAPSPSPPPPQYATGQGSWWTFWAHNVLSEMLNPTILIPIVRVCFVYFCRLAHNLYCQFYRWMALVKELFVRSFYFVIFLLLSRGTGKGIFSSSYWVLSKVISKVTMVKEIPWWVVKVFC